MDPLFETYFRTRFDEVSRSQFLDNIVRDSDPASMTSTAIRIADERLKLKNQSLRGDAQLLLYFSFAELVARPLIAVRGSGTVTGGIAVREVSNAVAHDIDLISQSAARASDDSAISAHTVLNVTSEEWENLETGRLGFWG